MERFGPLMGIYRRKAKQASVMWLQGFMEACCLHRVVIYCLSIFIVKTVIIPTLQWILPDQCPLISYEEPCSLGGILQFFSYLRIGLEQFFYVFWFYPLYIFSFVLSNIWYNDIAKYGFFAIGKDEPSITESSRQKELSTSQNTTNTDKPTDLGRVMIGIAEQIYSVLLLTFFFLEVYVTGYIPYIGKTLNFLLLSWMYAYYCFEYKWNLSGLSLDKRLDFFESNWAFFAGFGNILLHFRSPCALAIFLFSPLVSYGVMAILFPLFLKLLKSLELLRWAAVDDDEGGLDSDISRSDGDSEVGTDAGLVSSPSGTSRTNPRQEGILRTGLMCYSSINGLIEEQQLQVGSIILYL
ncbi:hypothetical protein RJ640_025577, partial [Escallonia rubra]